MDEIKIYLDKERKVEAGENIEFGQVMAGEITKRSIYILNNTDYYIDIELGLKGEGISIHKDVKQIVAHKTEKVVFEFRPKITLMKPIRAKLKININYVVK